MKKEMFSTRVLAEIAVLTALAFVLDLMQSAICKILPFWPNGGSVGISMIPIIILAYRRGLVPGLLGGLAMGIFDLLDGADISPMADEWYKAFASVALDYILAWLLVGFAGIVGKWVRNAKNKKIGVIYALTGTFIAGMLRFLSVFLSGLLMWPNYDMENPTAINMQKFIFSLSYNSSYMIPTIILTMIVIAILFIAQPKIIFLNNEINKEELSNEE